MEPIGTEAVLGAIMVVIMILVILSVPSILLTVRNSARLLKKYRLLRSLDLSDKDDVPEKVLNEWNAAHSQMAYTTLITDEIEKLNGLRPALFQCELAIILMIILAIFPGFQTEILYLVIVMIVISVLTVLYGLLNMRNYTNEYLGILKEMDSNDSDGDNGAADGMYG